MTKRLITINKLLSMTESLKTRIKLLKIAERLRKCESLN